MMRPFQLILIVLVTACNTNGRTADVQEIANTILGEARGEGEHGMKLVGCDSFTSKIPLLSRLTD